MKLKFITLLTSFLFCCQLFGQYKIKGLDYEKTRGKNLGALRDYKSAFENYKLFAKNKNSLFNDENITKLVTLQKDYDSSKKEYVKTSMEVKKKEKWFYIAGIVALLVIAGLLISQGKQRKKLDFQKLEIKRKEAEALIELDNIKSKFLSSISYELHTLLSLIKCNVELMRKGIHNVENEAYLSEIENNNEKLIGLINKLLSNAIKFTPKAGKISIELSLSDKKEDTIILKVKDNGIGIPIDQIANVFDIFHQNSAHQKFIGSDIGLSLVKELSVSHGGEVGVESVENKGGSFEVSLFFRNKESETLQTKVMKQYLDIDYSIKEISHDVLENIEERNLEKALVLVVENNPDITNFIKKSLTDNFRIIESSDGTEGFEMAKKHVPDLIISDIMMHVIDGMELSTLIKEDDITRHIPIILLTAKSDQEYKIEGLKTGADAYLTKPFSIQELILRVNNLIRLRKVLRQKFSTTLVIKPEEMGLDSRDKVFIDQLIKTIEQNLSDSTFGVEHLADKIHLSASQLNRKLRAIMGQSTLKFIQNIRLQKAFEMLQAESDNISGIAYETGFESASYFSKVFKKHFGFLPSEVEKSA